MSFDDKRIRIVCPDGLTNNAQVFYGDEPLYGITAVSISMRLDHFVEATVTFEGPEVEIGPAAWTKAPAVSDE